MRTCSRKRIIVYRKYVMFIKQSPTRFTMVTKNDTKTGHFLIYICRQIIQNCFLISYYNNIAVSMTLCHTAYISGGIHRIEHQVCNKG